jgi:hypothetical protein
MHGTAIDLVLCLVFIGVLGAMIAVMYYLERSLDALPAGPVGLTVEGTQPETAGGSVTGR